MLSLDDPRWKDLHGGYRVPYDASEPLRDLERGDDVWDELWTELHHQGDVGEASYAAVPQLVRIGGALGRREGNLYALVSTIELARHRDGNPPIPARLRGSYEAAWRDLRALAIADLAAAEPGPGLRGLLGAIALSKGDRRLGALLAWSDDDEIDELLARHEG